MIKLYNTLSGKKEALAEQQKIRFFVCGPTVYDYLHIGNARTYIFFDFFANYLRSVGRDVYYLQNITDIDDKIIRRAAEEGKTSRELAAFYTEAYMNDMRALGIFSVTKYAPATEFITQIVAQVERLIEKGYAYNIDGDGWYFDIAKFADYGKLSHRTALAAEDSVSRIDEAIEKRNKGDFCLWKFSKEGEPSWTTALGDGRPGWHIEDTAISDYHFGPQYDIHGGGVDLKFPHHEAEIAQQEAASGRVPFVALWMHTGALLVGGKKMSKSDGSFITIRDFLSNHPPEILRWITLTHHYRSPLDYSEDLADQAQKGLSSIQEFFGRLTMIEKSAEGDKGGHRSGDAKKLREITDSAKAKFDDALADDVNTPLAIATIFELITAYQKKIWEMGSAEAEILKNLIKYEFGLLGLPLKNPAIPREIIELAGKRDELRSSKQFIQSDALRKEINELGYELEDTPKGPFLWPKQ